MNKIIVRFDSVSFSYSNVKVLENASFHIHSGEFIAMVGPNGSGKTTVLKLLFGLETPLEGAVEIFGLSRKNQSKNIKHENLAYVPQQIPSDNSFPITVRDTVRMGLLCPFNNYPKRNAGESDAVSEALEKTGIKELAPRLYGSLSGGQKRRVLVARALAARPKLLVLDEPTANMDMESEKRLYETLGAYKGNMTILVVTHDTEFVTSLTDRVLCLGDGCKIVQHKIETGISARHGDVVQQTRVLHEKNIPGDECCRSLP
jgi:zinc transport system ATP-binding protein